MANIKTFQIIIPCGGSCKSFYYVKASTTKKAKELSCEKAIEYYRNKRETQRFSIFHQPVRLANKLKVVEYDTETKKAKKGGVQFNLVRNYFKATFVGGGSKMEEWYDAEDVKPKAVKN